VNWWSLAVEWNSHLFLVIWRSAVQTTAAATLPNYMYYTSFTEAKRFFEKSALPHAVTVL
jgi:hypothetical protein